MDDFTPEFVLLGILFRSRPLRRCRIPIRRKLRLLLSTWRGDYLYLSDNVYRMGYCGEVEEGLMPITVKSMRTTLEIPPDLMQSARSFLGYKSKTDVVIYSLQELIRRDRLEKLSSLSGSIDLKIDLVKSRK